MDFNQILFRCSSLGKLMTEPREKAAKERGELSATAKTYCRELFVELRYGRKKEITSKYMEKGLMCEEDSLTLYSRHTKTFYKKNEERFSNFWITGLPDVADPVTDFKSSWDVFTFLQNRLEKYSNDHYWQLQGYMDLKKAQTSKLVFALINTPLTLINDEKRKLLYKMGVASDENRDYMAACEELERSMIFDDIPMKERIIEFQIDRNQSDIDRMHHKVEQGRRYMKELWDSFDNPTMAIASHDSEVKATIIDPLSIPLKKII